MINPFIGMDTVGDLVVLVAGDPGNGGIMMEGTEKDSSGNLPQIQFLHSSHGEPLYRYPRVHSR